MMTRLSPTTDVMQFKVWSLPMAAAWLIWRTEEAVHDALYEPFSHKPSLELADLFVRACDPDRVPLMDGATAQVELWSAMLSGRLRPTGMPTEGSVRVPILAEEWRKFDFLVPPGGRHPQAIGTFNQTLYEIVFVDRKDVLLVWPAHEVKDDQRVAETSAVSANSFHSENHTSVAAENRFEQWLIGEMLKSPNQRRKNSDLRSSPEAQGISKRAFERAKRSAISKCGALAWGNGGAPKKT